MRSKAPVAVRPSGSALPLPTGEAELLLVQRIPAGTGRGAILGQFLRTMGAHGPECAPENLDRVGRVARDLITACPAERCDTHGDLPAESQPVR
ncbi:hypothetical protein ACGFZK_11185 [Streptomyces sp. NPDC048257]|uniref:hypothetical protein n=1 Tax=Streptomyces sp. NPDC048257 TaxID=3365526 RepID=UPI003720080B